MTCEVLNYGVEEEGLFGLLALHGPFYYYREREGEGEGDFFVIRMEKVV